MVGHLTAWAAREQANSAALPSAARCELIVLLSRSRYKHLGPTIRVLPHAHPPHTNTGSKHIRLRGTRDIPWARVRLGESYPHGRLHVPSRAPCVRVSFHKWYAFTVVAKATTVPDHQPG